MNYQKQICCYFLMIKNVSLPQDNRSIVFCFAKLKILWFGGGKSFLYFLFYVSLYKTLMGYAYNQYTEFAHTLNYVISTY